MEINTRNANTLFSDMFRHLSEHGVPSGSRNGRVLRFPEPVLTTVRNPAERVLLHRGRDANPIFHLMEAIWMLAGRQDVAFLSMFNSTIHQYSDDGQVFNAAYGYRWREHFGVDQLTNVIHTLKADPGSRQAVIQMWDAGDLVKQTKDKACLAGHTRFASPEESHSIKVLARMFKDGNLTRYPVYGVDVESGNTTLTWLTAVWSNGVKPVLKITGANGEVLRCTDDHVVWVRRKVFEGKVCVRTDLVETCAGDLKTGDTLLSVKFDVDSNYKRFKRNTFENTGYGNMVQEHKEYARLLFGNVEGVQVHHLDENPLRNHQNNLCLMTAAGHSGHHRLNDNPMRNMSAEMRKFKGEEHRKVLLSRGEYRPISATTLAVRETIREPMESQIRVISVERDGEEEVFDFTVPETHNAATLDGFVVHNCNTQLMFEVLDGALNMTVINRSNDMYYGYCGANIVHMTMLQEFVASALGVELGAYRTFSTNLHLYLDLYDAQGYVAAPPVSADYDCYSNAEKLTPLPMMLNGDWYSFLGDCEKFCRDPFDGSDVYAHPFFLGVAHPMAMVSRVRKARAGTGEGWADKVRAPDWRRAAFHWIQARESKKQLTSRSSL